MPITTVYSPTTGKLFSAYRQIAVNCLAPYSATNNPVVYCDIYCDGVYYKTLSSTSPLQVSGSSAIWSFDLQDAAQELCRPVWAPVDHADDFTHQDSLAVLFVKMRGSVIDGSGVLQPDGPVPVQSTFDTPAASGGGMQSNTFYAINAVLQPEDNPDLATHLSLLNSAYYGNTANIKVLPLTHRVSKNYYNGRNDFDSIGFMFPHNGNAGTNNTVTLAFQIAWRTHTGTPGATNSSNYFTFSVPMIHSMPTGLPQLQQIPWPIAIPWDDIATYTVAFRSIGPLPVTVWRSPEMVVDREACGKRLRFLNYLGMMDGVSFSRYTDQLKTKSDAWERRAVGRQRYNVRSEDVLQLVATQYNERAQPWLKELFDSPDVRLQQPAIQGQSPALLPVLVADGTSTHRKPSERHIYETVAEVTMAQPNTRQRN